MHWLELFEDLDQEHVIRASLSLTIVYMGISCFRFWTNRGQRDDQIVRLLSSIYVAMNKYLIWVWSMIDMIEVKIRSFLFVLISEILFFLIIFIYQISDQIWAFGDDYRNLHFFSPQNSHDHIIYLVIYYYYVSYIWSDFEMGSQIQSIVILEFLNLGHIFLFRFFFFIIWNYFSLPEKKPYNFLENNNSDI